MTAKTDEHIVGLGHGLEMRASFPSLDGSVEVAIAHDDHVLLHKTFTPDDGRADFTIDGSVVRADGSLDLDAFSGELVWEGHLSVRAPGGDEWHEVIDVDRRALMRFCPAIGSFGGETAVEEPVVEDERFGRSQLCTPVALRIYVEDEDRAITDIGRTVKQRMFPDHPPFVFNTIACVGGVKEDAPGLYTDPNSIWFNVFFGYYQLDAPKKDWSRPFAYRSAEGIDSEIEIDDLLRLGKSDWNWFSNYLYGVPIESILPYSGVSKDGIGIEHSEPLEVGSTLWQGITLRNVEVASCYESDMPGAQSLTTNTIIDDVWRHSFGLPNPQPDHPDSFIPTTIDAALRLAYHEDDEAFHTTIFGGTAASGADPAFIEAQLEAVKDVVERNYPGLGFKK
jgi:hypothetical protein